MNFGHDGIPAESGLSPNQEGYIPVESPIYYTDSETSPLHSEEVSHRASSGLTNRNPSPPGILTQVLDGSENLNLYRNWQNLQTPPLSEISVQYSPAHSENCVQYSSATPRSGVQYSLASSFSNRWSPLSAPLHSEHGYRPINHYSLHPEHQWRHRQRLERLTARLRQLLVEFVELEAPVYNSTPEMCLDLMHMNAFYIHLTHK
ncbi:uncharacterized protein LOC120525319 [Polypterus senegalus]|uniref:uncharacterized protein LOC120525319 n=1 Tax=Polypterus senegalus TaxID=55291 RepID=UPI00196631B2|nr:uncharacterized protein LOC120525319 [Polypterus senegalus]